MALFLSSFRAWHGRSKSGGGGCNRKLGDLWGTGLQRSLGVRAVLLILALRHNRRLLAAR